MSPAENRMTASSVISHAADTIGRSARVRARLTRTAEASDPTCLPSPGSGRQVDRDAVAAAGLVVATPRSAYGPACSTRTSTKDPSHDAGPWRCTSLLWRVRPESRTNPSGHALSVPAPERDAN